MTLIVRCALRFAWLCSLMGWAGSCGGPVEDVAPRRGAAVGVAVSCPRPGAPVLAFAATPEPPAPVATGTVVSLWDAPGAPLSKDGQAVRLALAAMGIPFRALSGDLAAAQLSGASLLVLTGDLSSSNVSSGAAAALDASNVASVVATWLAVVDRNLITGAPTVLLLHATSRAGKVAALQAFLSGLQRRDVWVGDLRSLGSFYEAQGF